MDSADQYEDSESVEDTSASAPSESWREPSSHAQCGLPSSTPSQFEDADDEWNSKEQSVTEDGQWLAPPETSGEGGEEEGDIGEEEKYSASDGGEGGEGQSGSRSWTWERTGEKTWKVTGAFTDPGHFSDANTDGDNLSRDSITVSVESAVLERNSASERVNASESEEVMNSERVNASLSEEVMNVSGDGGDVTNSYAADSVSDGQWMDVQDSSVGDQHTQDAQTYEGDQLWDAENLVYDPSLGEAQDPEYSTVHEGDASCSNIVPEGESVTDAEGLYPEPDDSMALVPYVPRPDSPSSTISSTSSSPRPPHYPGAGPNMASAATGIPLHQNPLGVGQARFVRIHPMHIAAAVAAQHSQAAAMMHQQTRMAAAAMQHQAAVRHQAAAAAVRHQASAAMAAAQQRTRAALLHQQIVRSRYMGAPVLVRQPFVPVPRVAAPMRVRMRLRRSVMLTEEINLHQP